MSKLERRDVYGGLYKVNTDGEVRSYEREVTYRSTRRNVEVTYTKPEQKLKVDWKKVPETGHLLGRVQLYDGEGERDCFYVSRLVYTAFNGLQYDEVTQVHYKDGNTKNMKLENLYVGKRAT